QTKHQRVVARGLDDQMTLGLEHPVDFRKRTQWIVDVFNHVVQQDDVERLVGNPSVLEDGIDHGEPMLLTSNLASVDVGLDPEHVPTIVFEFAQQETEAAPDLQQMTALRVELVEESPCRTVVPDLEPFLLVARYVLEEGVHRGIIVDHLNGVGGPGSRIRIHQPAAVAPDDLAQLRFSSAKDDGRGVDPTEVARHRLRHLNSSLSVNLGSWASSSGVTR